MPPKPSKPPLTHFLAIPLATSVSTPQLSASLARFAVETSIQDEPPRTKEINPSYEDPLDLLLPQSAPLTSNVTNASPPASSSATSTRVLPPRAIRPATTLHLTIGMMSLRSPERVASAIAVLRSLQPSDILQEAAHSNIPSPSEAEAPASTTNLYSAGQSQPAVSSSLLNDTPDSWPEPVYPLLKESNAPNASSPPPLVLTLKGLHPMQSPRSTSILYVHPEDATERLRPFAERLRSKFEDAGLVINESRGLKLHATVVNMVYARERRGVRRGGRKGGRGRGRGRGEGGQGRHVEGRGGDGEKDGDGGEEDVISRLAKGAGDRGEGVEGGEGEQREGGKGAEEGTGAERKGPGRGKIDARELVERWKNEVWAEVRVDRIAICEMGAKAGEDGAVRYREVASIDMP